MAIPKSVKVGGKYYSLKAQKGMAQEDDSYGKCNTQTCTIKYDPDVNRQQVRDTLWHEVKHAVYGETGLSHDLEEETTKVNEEQLVLRSSTLELQVMRENPDLMEFLLEED